MAVFDRLLKQLVTNFAPDFAAWLLNAEIDETEALISELPVETVVVDALFRVRLADGRVTLLHIEFQGRRSHRPMPIRMLDYLARLVQQYELPIHSVVFYLDRGSGSSDTGQHQHIGLNGNVILTWNYHVIHLWRMQAEDLLAMDRYSLLPLVSLTQIATPTETLPRVLAKIRSESEPDQQVELLKQLVGLMKDEEIIAMTKELLTDLELEELKEFPYLWEQYQRYQEKVKSEGRAEGRAEGLTIGKIEGERQKTRDNILEVIAVRFNPTAMEYRRVEQVLTTIEDIKSLSDLFSLALRASEYTEFEQELLARQRAAQVENNA